MKRAILLGVIILGGGFFLAGGAQAASLPMGEPFRLAVVDAYRLKPLSPYSLREKEMPSTGEAIRLAAIDGSKIKPLDSRSLTKEQMQYIGKARKWSNISIFFLVGNVASLPITFAVDELAGGMVALVTFSGWMISHGMAAFAYRDLDLSYLLNGTTAPSTKTPRYSHILAASFGVGAMTAIGLSFSDSSGAGAAVAMISICSFVSWVSGIVGIVTTHGYAKKVGYSTASELAPFNYSEYPNKLRFSELPGGSREPRMSRGLIYLPLTAMIF